jgi:hypothetical protein
VSGAPTWSIVGVRLRVDAGLLLIVLVSIAISVPLLSSHQGPNVEVSVTVGDCIRDCDIPFAVIGTDAALKGQGTAISWNPYVAAAKFVVHQVQGQDAIATLADQIARKVLDQRQELMAHDPL